jgi:sulfite reductase beta subunit
MAESTQERRTDFGPPHYEQFLPPVIKKNYGKWKYHEVIKPGVMVHVSESGDKVYTVRGGSPRLLSVDKIRMYCDLADKYCGGHLRFTSRHNVEFLTDEQKNIDPLIKDLKAIGHPVGGIGNSISAIVHTQGWVHCHSAATDASGIVKAVMDDLIEYFENMTLPGKLRIALASTCAAPCTAPISPSWGFTGVRRRPTTSGCPRCASSRLSRRLVPPRPSGRPPWTASSLSRSSKSCACSAAIASPSVLPCP